MKKNCTVSSSCFWRSSGGTTLGRTHRVGELIAPLEHPAVVALLQHPGKSWIKTIKVPTREGATHHSPFILPRCTRGNVRHLDSPLFYICPQRFSEGADILVEFVHLREQQPWEVRPESSMDRELRPVRGTLYADDASIASRSPRAFAQMMEVIVQVCNAFGLSVHKKERDYVDAHTTYATIGNVGRRCGP